MKVIFTSMFICCIFGGFFAQIINFTITENGSNYVVDFDVDITSNTTQSYKVGFCIGVNPTEIINNTLFPSSTSSTFNQSLTTKGFTYKTTTSLTATNNPTYYHYNQSISMSTLLANHGKIYYIRPFIYSNSTNDERIQLAPENIKFIWNKNRPTVSGFNPNINLITSCVELGYDKIISGLFTHPTENVTAMYCPIIGNSNNSPIITSRVETIDYGTISNLQSSAWISNMENNITFYYDLFFLDNSATPYLDESTISVTGEIGLSLTVSDAAIFYYLSEPQSIILNSNLNEVLSHPFTDQPTFWKISDQSNLNGNLLTSITYNDGYSSSITLSDFLLGLSNSGQVFNPGSSKYSQFRTGSLCFSENDESYIDTWIPTIRLHTPDLSGFQNQSICDGSLLEELNYPPTVTKYIDNNISQPIIYSWAFFSDELSTTPLDPTIDAVASSLVIRYMYDDGTNIYFSDTYSTLNVNVKPLGTWLGASGVTWNINDPNDAYYNALNWCGGVVPQTPTIPENVTVYLDGSYDFTNVTVECGGALIITETGRVTITNVLTNGGIVQVINGGTIKIGSKVDGTCPGTYKYAETLATDRFWYVGPTTTNTVRADFGTVYTGAQNDPGTQMWSWNEATNATTGYVPPVYLSGTTLKPGNGYVYRRPNAAPLNIDVTGPYVTSSITHSGLSRTGTGSLAGYHLISNPYTAYLNADDIFSVSNTGTSNMVSSIWVRSNSVANGGPGTMVFDTYNTSSGIGTGLGWQTGALNGNATNINNLMKWIAPMQGFWVRVNTTGNGSVAYNYAMSNANPTGAGQLRSTSNISGLARLNVTFGTQKDQMVAALSANATNAFEAYDSEKMFTSGVVQLYAPNSGKKLAINTLKNNKSKVSMPLTVECPGAGWYTFDLVELDLDNGVLFLEDKLNGEMKDLSLDPSYQFYATSGVLQNRFILHFHLPSQISNVSGPSSLEDLVSESQNATIEIASTSTGKVTVTLDQVDEVTNSAVRICDLNGRIVDSLMADGKSFEFQINQGQGAYLIEVTNGLTVEKKKVFIQ